MSKEAIKAKVTLVGDGTTGKSCLLLRLTKSEFNSEYTPTIFENTTHALKVSKRAVKLDLWDTAGQEDYNRINLLSYPDNTLFLIVFSIDNVDSYNNVDKKWVPEVKFHCANVPYILVGRKKDLRHNADKIEELVKTGQSPVGNVAGQDLAKRIGALAYFECSARDGEGVEELFTAVGKWVYKDYKRKNSCKAVKKVWEKLKNLFD